MTLSGRPRRTLRAVHVVLSGAWLGLCVAMITLGAGAMLTDDPAFALASHTMAGRLALAIPVCAVGSILTGVALSVATPWGLVRHWWIVVKIVLAFATIATAIGLGGTWREQAVARLGADAVDGAAAGLPGWLVVGSSVAHLVMLAAATVISVEKPWGRTRERRARATTGSAYLPAVRVRPDVRERRIGARNRS